MLRITIDLLSARTGKCTTLGVAEIGNDGTGTQTYGNYNVRLFKWGSGRRLWRTGKVTEFPRQRRGPWDLLYQALDVTLGVR